LGCVPDDCETKRDDCYSQRETGFEVFQIFWIHITIDLIIDEVILDLFILIFLRNTILEKLGYISIEVLVGEMDGGEDELLPLIHVIFLGLITDLPQGKQGRVNEWFKIEIIDQLKGTNDQIKVVINVVLEITSKGLSNTINDVVDDSHLGFVESHKVV
jgi:hypothetical protein